MTFDPELWRQISKESLVHDWEASFASFASYSKNPNQTLSSWVGADLPLMQRKVSHALDRLWHDDHLHRAGAVYLLRYYWPITEHTATAAVALMPFDQSAIVRGTVYNLLPGFYSWIPDPDGVLEDLLLGCPEIHHQAAVEARKIRAYESKRKRVEWVEKIGPLAGDMLGDIALVENAFQDSDPQVRHVALEVMALELKPNYNVASLVSQMVKSRQELDDIRKLAVNVLSKYWRITHDHTFNHLFISLIKDDLCPDEIRFFAYLALVDIRSSSRSPSLNQLRGHLLKHSDLMNRFRSGKFRFPDDVDWAFVESFNGER